MKINCYVCRKEIDDTDNYCRYCGARLEKKLSSGGFSLDLKPPTVDTSKLFVKPATFVAPPFDNAVLNDAAASSAESDEPLISMIDKEMPSNIVNDGSVAEEALEPPAASVEYCETPDLAASAVDEALKESDEPAVDDYIEEQAAPELGDGDEWYVPLTNAGGAFVKSLWEKIKLESEKYAEKLEDGDYDHEKYARENSQIKLKEDGTRLLNTVKNLSKYFTDGDGNQDDDDDDDW